MITVVLPVLFYSHSPPSSNSRSTEAWECFTGSEPSDRLGLESAQPGGCESQGLLHTVQSLIMHSVIMHKFDNAWVFTSPTSAPL